MKSGHFVPFDLNSSPPTLNSLKPRERDEIQGNKKNNATQCTKAYTVAFICCS